MGRGARYLHARTGETVVKHDRDQAVLLCGEEYFLARSSDDETKVDCPKCSALLGEKALAEYNAATPNKALSLEKADKPENPHYRVAYRALVGGEHVGYIVYDGAFANGRWHITEQVQGKDDVWSTGVKLYKEVGKYSRIVELEFRSKEQALLAVPNFVESGDLKTKEQIKRGVAERRAFNKALAEREASEKADAERIKAETIAGLEEIRDTVELTNYQRNAIENALLCVFKNSL